MPTYQQRHWKVSSNDTRRQWPNKHLKANAPACTTGHCGLDSAIMTMQRSHTSDDATQLCNAPHGRYGLDSAIVTTQRSQPSDDATQPRNAPARHDDNDSPACSAIIHPCMTCTQPPRTATATTTAQRAPNAGMMSMVPSGLSGAAICLCTTCMQPPRRRQPNLHPACTTPDIRLTCLSMYSSEPQCDALMTQHRNDPDNTIQPRLRRRDMSAQPTAGPPPTHHNHAPRAVDKELYNIFIRLSIIDAT
ncbi:hypothetical protein BU15DRAFT_64530 [Melanogaster broomeanus]|nr:hypothetical protein BU15DRAFT_64530 [Melanogaster broomeanus]